VICASLCKESGFLTSATNIEKGYEAEQEWVSVGAGAGSADLHMKAGWESQGETAWTSFGDYA
jgi:hypothetical protein